MEESEKGGGMRNSRGQFVKGSTPHNKGRKWEEWMPDGSREGSLKHTYKKGNLPHNTLPKGSIAWRRDQWVINIDRHGNRHTNYNYRKWLWETANDRDAPKEFIFTALDGDFRKEPTLENIEVINRAELARRNRGWRRLDF